MWQCGETGPMVSGSASGRPRQKRASGFRLVLRADNRPLWLLRDVLASDGWVIVVEGEKCGQAAKEAWPDKTVTTWAGGTNAWQLTDWEPLRGRKVSLIADADPLNKEAPGHKAMRDLAAHLHGMGAIVKLVLPPVEWDSDVADWLAADGAEATSARIQSMLEDYEPPPPAPSLVREDKLSSEWQRIADKHADQVRERFRFDIDRRAWWQWLGCRWIEVVDDHAITDILTEDRLLLAHEFERDGRSDLSTKLENSREWATQINGSRSEWWARMRTNLARPTPAPPEWQLATPDGVVDLRTGKVEPHDPFEHDTLAVTKGHYRTGAGDESYLFDVLENRLESNMAREDLESLLELLGLGITGEAPVKRPCILWVSGPSGSGKGMVGNLVLEAFGSVAHAVKAETLQRRSNDIDSEIASVLEANPRLIVCDEMGGKVSEKKWMGLTGNTPLDRPGGQSPPDCVRRDGGKGE